MLKREVSLDPEGGKKKERNETDSREVAEWSVKFGEALQHLAGTLV